jgi:O-acetyl-ADP-ribose deacetylase (regulator of RNase III)
MKLEEKKMNLFDVDDKYYFAHCISTDCAMGAGIAIEFNNRFGLRGVLAVKYDKGRRKHPTCILEKKVLNLITKENYWHKPTYETMQGSLDEMKRLVVKNNIKYIAMPKIGCGLDKLQWDKVKEMIEATFSDTDIEILVCYL